MHELAGVGALLVIIFLGTYILQALVVAIAISIKVAKVVLSAAVWLTCLVISPRKTMAAQGRAAPPAPDPTGYTPLDWSDPSLHD